MGKVKDEQLFSLLRNFLLIYLPNQRHASSNTVKAYRTAWNQLLKYIAGQKKIPMMSVTFGMIRYEMVVAYLDWLSEEKGVGPATRNNRLAAIRAFITYASACRPEYISLSSELAAIKIQKKERFREVDYMSEAAVKALFAAPDTRTKMGLRDQFLMIFLYDTGARIQEALDVKICDLRIDKTPTVTLHGKGGKIRVVPLMKDTVQHLDNYMGAFHKGESAFSTEWLFYVERKGSRSAMCDDTARLRIQKYAELARETCPDVPERVHPHLWRHTRAMHLYQHGMDLTMISQWLGHKQVETTLIYAYADTEAKRKAIEKAMGAGLADAESVNYTVSDEDMKAKIILKRSIDSAMYILFLLLMGQCVLRGVIHEWLGIAVGILFVCHNVLNFKWYQTLRKGKYNVMRAIQLIINILLLLAMLLCMFGGILASQYIFAVGSGKMIELGRHLHLVSTAWAFVLMSFHLGFHWSIFSAISKKIRTDEKVKKVIHIICCVFVAVLFAYGVYQFADRRFWEELFHLIDYQYHLQ